jgi:hypothetical protein
MSVHCMKLQPLGICFLSMLAVELGLSSLGDGRIRGAGQTLLQLAYLRSWTETERKIVRVR